MAKTKNNAKNQTPFKSKSNQISKKNQFKPNKPRNFEAAIRDSVSAGTSGSGSIESSSEESVPAARTAHVSELGFDPTELREMLEPYSREQLVDLLCTSAQKHPSLFTAVRENADRDVTHRKIFVHSLAWEATRESLVAAFKPYGEIEECNIVTDKNTGKSKGYGFVLFRSRQGAREALKEPKKRILNRIASCQLAAMGPVASTRDNTGPVKISLGQGTNYGHLANNQQLQGQQVPSPGQNLALFGQQAVGMNPVYGAGLFGGPGLMNPLLASALSHGGMVPTSQVGAFGGLGAALGAYFGGQNLQNPYASSQNGQMGGNGESGDHTGDGSLPRYSTYM